MLDTALIAANLDFLDPRFWLATGALIVSILLAAFVIWLARNYWKGAETPTAHDQLSHFRALYEKGELSEEEFSRLRDVLSPTIRASVGLNPSSRKPPDTPPPGATPPDGIQTG